MKKEETYLEIHLLPYGPTADAPGWLLFHLQMRVWRGKALQRKFHR
jgi:hypothetical protein